MSLKIRFTSILSGAVILWVAAGFSPESLRPFELEGVAQGTTWHITYYANTQRFSKQQADSVFARIDSSLSIYKPYSLISRFNQSPDGVMTDVHLANVMRKSLSIFADSRGLFDVTVFPIVKAWGFGTEKPAETLPDSAAIREIMKCVGSEKLYWDGEFLRKHVACVQLDVNGIAQGYTVDVIADLLEKRGVMNYLVEVGGELRVRGYKEPGRVPMKIGIECPASYNEERQDIRKIISVDHGAITTSGTYRKQRTTGKRVISHLMNPRTGYPLSNEMISATVIAPDAITADGYDNVLMNLGVTQSLQFLKNHRHLQAYLIYRKSDGTIGDVETTGFSKLLVRNP